MRRVFVINRGGHDYSRAERWGSLVYCSEGLVSKSDIGKMFRTLEEKLAGSGPDDLILISGLSSMSSVASAIFAKLHSRLNLLIYWDGDYVERNIFFAPLPSNLKGSTGEQAPSEEADG